MPYIHVHIPLVVIVLDQGKCGNIVRPANRVKRPEFITEVLHLRQLPIVPIVVVQNTVPINLSTEAGGPPPEKGDEIGSLGNALHSPKGQLPRPRRGTLHSVRPSVSAGLLLHYAKMRTDRASFGEVTSPFTIVQVCFCLRSAVKTEGKTGV